MKLDRLRWRSLLVAVASAALLSIPAAAGVSATGELPAARTGPSAHGAAPAVTAPGNITPPYSGHQTSHRSGFVRSVCGGVGIKSPWFSLHRGVGGELLNASISNSSGNCPNPHAGSAGESGTIAFCTASFSGPSGTVNVSTQWRIFVVWNLTVLRLGPSPSGRASFAWSSSVALTDVTNSTTVSGAASGRFGVSVTTGSNNHTQPNKPGFAPYYSNSSLITTFVATHQYSVCVTLRSSVTVGVGGGGSSVALASLDLTSVELRRIAFS